MLVGDYCNRDVVTIGKNESIRNAAKLMRKHHVGDVLVVESKNGTRIPIGMLTDRDIVVEVIADDVDMDDLWVEDIMSFRLVTSNEKDDLMKTIKRMRINGVRRIPIVNQAGGLVGILSIDDILDVITEQLMDLDQIIAKENSNEREKRIELPKH
jgi:CBS domain-containing protein